jgi:prevent-host-death family protein
MRDLKLTEDIVPVGEFKGHAARWLKHAAETGQPVVITQNGRPAGVLLSAAEFDRLGERQRFLESVAAGLADIEAGRSLTTTELKSRIARRRAGPGTR